MKSASASNRRKNPRLHCSVPVEGKKGGAFAQTQTLDISKGGLGILSKKAIPLQKQIAVALELAPDTDPVLVMGRVKWVERDPRSKDYRVGMEFTDKLSEDVGTQLNRYFRHQPGKV